MTVGEMYRFLRDATLSDSGEREAVSIARYVMESVMGLDPVALVTRSAEEVPNATLSRLREIAIRLSHGEPVQYILGEAWFHGLKLHVSPGVLIPRPETSQLVDLITDMTDGQADLDIIDLGTGSGAIAVALARSLRFPHITAVDISETAIETARKNASDLGTEIDIVKGDMLDTSSLPNGPWHIVVSNPPYIAPDEAKTMERRVLDYEPGLALFAPEGDPLCFYRAVAAYAHSTLQAGGILAFEINPDYAAGLENMLRQTGFSDVQTQRDFCGRLRFSFSRR